MAKLIVCPCNGWHVRRAWRETSSFITALSVPEELIQFISAADIYITPYLDVAQITSGTLAYTLGAGKAIISTPYWYAEEMLAEERGALVPFDDPQALAGQVIDLLNNEAQRHAMRKRAYLFGRDMIWPQVARRYMQSFERAHAEHRYLAAAEFAVKPLDRRAEELPPLKLDHLRHLTDDTGIFQHAIFTIPNYREGYTTDDNARALMVSALLEEIGNTEAVDLATRYLAFTWYAFNTETRRFRNFMDYQRQWLEDSGSDDSHGRALWALGTILGHSNTPTLYNMAGRVFQQSLLAILETTSPRAWAFALIGIHEYLQRFAGDRRVSQVREELAGRLLALYKDNRVEEWNWFEDRLTYCNAALSHAMLLCGQSIPNPAMTEAGLESLNWLAKIQYDETEGKAFRAHWLQWLLSTGRRTCPLRSTAGGGAVDGLGLSRSQPCYRKKTVVPGSPARFRMVSRTKRLTSPALRSNHRRLP